MPAIRTLSVLILAVAVLPLTGCQKRLVAERNALFAQNTELQEELERSRSALDSAESDRQQMLGQMNQLQGQLAVERAKPPVEIRVPVLTPAANTTGFASIEGIETVTGQGTITVRVPGDVLFSAGKSTLRSAAKKTLGKIASVIKKDYDSNVIRVEGYTDTDPIRKSKWADNLDLSLARSAAVHRYLQKKGVKAKQLQAVGFGQWHPRSNKAKSRRVEIVVILND